MGTTGWTRRHGTADGKERLEYVTGIWEAVKGLEAARLTMDLAIERMKMKR